MYLYKTVIAQQNIQSFMRLLDKERSLDIGIFHELRWNVFCYTVKYSESVLSKSESENEPNRTELEPPF
jgi:hypothetical protein